MVLYNQKDMLESLDEASCLFVDLINFRSYFMDSVDLNAVVFRNGLFYSNTNNNGQISIRINYLMVNKLDP